MFLVSASAIFIPSVSYAAQAGVIQNPLKNITDVPTLVNTILGYVLEVGSVVAIVAFIYSGYKFVAARGNPEGLKKAKDIFFNTCIGVAILLGAKIIATIIISTIKNLQS